MLRGTSFDLSEFFADESPPANRTAPLLGDKTRVVGEVRWLCQIIFRNHQVNRTANLRIVLC